MAADWFGTHVEGKLAPNTEGGYRNLIFNYIVPKLGGVKRTNLLQLSIMSVVDSSGITVGDLLTKVKPQIEEMQNFLRAGKRV